MEMLVKKYQQKYKKARDEMDKWDELQSRLLVQFRNASPIIERLEVLQEPKSYGVLKSIDGIGDGVLGKQMFSLEVILQSVKETMRQFHGVVVSLEKILRDSRHLANGASRPLTQNQMQLQVGIQPSIAKCIEGLSILYEMYHSEYLLKLSAVSSLMSKQPQPRFPKLGAAQTDPGTVNRFHPVYPVNSACIPQVNNSLFLCLPLSFLIRMGPLVDTHPQFESKAE